jgi:hypothetical protein
MRKLSILLLSFILYSCGAENYENVSFSEQVKPILKKECLQCHSENEPASGLILTKYYHLFDNENYSSRTPLVEPGNPKLSNLYILISTNKEAVRMPPKSYGYDKMDESDIKIIKTWIEEGAKNN